MTSSPTTAPERFETRGIVGARNVIATLWSVEDRSTAKVMAGLYGGLRSGQPEASALATAQRAALRNPATADPFYWAGFVLVGTR